MKYFSWEDSILKAEKSAGTYKYITFVIFYSLGTNVISLSLLKKVK